MAGAVGSFVDVGFYIIQGRIDTGNTKESGRQRPLSCEGRNPAIGKCNTGANPVINKGEPLPTSLRRKFLNNTPRKHPG